MQILRIVGLGLAFAGAAAGLTATTAQAQRYRVVCIAPAAPNCATACGSNTHTVVCYAAVRNGRCVKYCGRPR